MKANDNDWAAVIVARDRARIAELEALVRAHAMYDDDECGCGFRASDDEHDCHEMRWYRRAIALVPKNDGG